MDNNDKVTPRDIDDEEIFCKLFKVVNKETEKIVGYMTVYETFFLKNKNSLWTNIDKNRTKTLYHMLSELSSGLRRNVGLGAIVLEKPKDSFEGNLKGPYKLEQADPYIEQMFLEYASVN